MQELTTDYANQLRPSRTEYDSAKNLNICQFVSIRGIRGLCGIGVLARFEPGHAKMFLRKCFFGISDQVRFKPAP